MKNQVLSLAYTLLEIPATHPGSDVSLLAGWVTPELGGKVRIGIPIRVRIPTNKDLLVRL